MAAQRTRLASSRPLRMLPVSCHFGTSWRLWLAALSAALCFRPAACIAGLVAQGRQGLAAMRISGNTTERRAGDNPEFSIRALGPDHAEIYQRQEDVSVAVEVSVDTYPAPTVASTTQPAAEAPRSEAVTTNPPAKEKVIVTTTTSKVSSRRRRRKKSSRDKVAKDTSLADVAKDAREGESAEAVEKYTPGSGVTMGDFLKELSQQKADDNTCLSGIGEEGKLQFGRPRKGLESYMSEEGRLFLVGDSVIGQLCALGNPGLCCSNTRPCVGSGPYNGGAWEVVLHEKDAGWQHHSKYRARSADNRGMAEAFLLAPQVHNDVDKIADSVRLLQGFFNQTQPTSKDVLILGMIGNHFNKFLSAFEKYVGLLMKGVVNTFPGRVVLLGYSPQHFAGTGHWEGEASACTPPPEPGEIATPMNSIRKSIYLYEVWKYMKHPQARIVDLYQMLIPLWSCHRNFGDCTHWKDSVISLQAQLVLDALERIKESGR